MQRDREEDLDRLERSIAERPYAERESETVDSKIRARICMLETFLSETRVINSIDNGNP